MAKKRIFIKIYGEVTGVSFRYYACQQAGELGVLGYVRNCGDGTVEIEVEAEEERLKELLEWARKGSRYAKVEKVEYKWGEYRDEFKNFEIKY